jgi:hypothetical protein
MTSPQPFEYFLSCTHSGFPGDEWDAWIGFRPIKNGFSVWAGGSNPDGDGPSRKRIATCKQELNWRTACQALLNASDGSIWGDFRSDITVDGADGSIAELLALCWMKEDEISDNIKDYLIAISDDDLEWLERAVGGDITSDESLTVIGAFLDVANVSESPRSLYSRFFPGARKSRLADLVQALEKEESDRAASVQRDIEARLEPFLAQMHQIVLQKSSSADIEQTKDEQYVERSQLADLSGALRSSVLSNGHLPSDSEISEIWNDIKSKPVAVMKWGKVLYYLNMPAN